VRANAGAQFTAFTAIKVNGDMAFRHLSLLFNQHSPAEVMPTVFIIIGFSAKPNNNYFTLHLAVSLADRLFTSAGVPVSA
jgi:hypothetical protein